MCSSLRDWRAVLLLKMSFDTCDWLSLLSSSGINSGEMQPPQHSSMRVDHRRPVSTDSLFREIYDDSADEDDEEGYADPIQDDLYARKMGIKPQPASNVSHDKFLPKFWTPEEDLHIQKIKLGSQRRPWYKKMQGFRCVRALKSSIIWNSLHIYTYFKSLYIIFYRDKGDTIYSLLLAQSTLTFLPDTLNFAILKYIACQPFRS